MEDHINMPGKGIVGKGVDWIRLSADGLMVVFGKKKSQGVDLTAE
jgi:hypothetical protein